MGIMNRPAFALLLSLLTHGPKAKGHTSNHDQNNRQRHLRWKDQNKIQSQEKAMKNSRNVEQHRSLNGSGAVGTACNSNADCESNSCIDTIFQTMSTCVCNTSTSAGCGEDALCMIFESSQLPPTCTKPMGSVCQENSDCETLNCNEGICQCNQSIDFAHLGCEINEACVSHSEIDGFACVKIIQVDFENPLDINELNPMFGSD
mmetsp:Transcript_8778/g.12432  ORF Transcript_8778/g.12432 Transcript_8778/m.12432 type:complete len:204 (+) Transcript_8778:20-631(+)